MISLQKNVALKNFSNFHIGGNASYFLDVKNYEDLLDGIKKWKELIFSLSENQKKIFILGGGTNVLFADEGFDGLVIKNSMDGIEFTEIENMIRVGSGTEVSALLEFCILNSLQGLEWAGGLPGTVGGAIRGNAGAFNGETKDNTWEVISLDLNSLKTIKRTASECDFSYRYSIFKKPAKNEIIISSVFNLEKGDGEEIKNKIYEKIEHRKKRHPLEYPNLGSIFKNVPFVLFSDEKQKELSQYVKNDPFPVVPTAKLIFLAGLKGKKIGNVMVSEKHTNFIVNLGNGKAQEVKELIEVIKNKIKEKFGITLEEEIMYLD